MSFSLGGYPLVRGTIFHPGAGALVADLEISADAAPSLAGQQTLALPGLDLKVTVVSGGTSTQRTKIRVAAGAGGLGKQVEGQHFNKTTLRGVAEHLLRKAGEQLAADSDAAILGRQLEHWQHVRATAAQGLDRLCAAAGTIWYVDADGKVHIGDHAWSVVEPDHVLEHEDLVGQAWTISSLQDTVRPGTTFRGQRVGAVEHTIEESGRARSIVRWGAAQHPFDEDMRALVRHHQVHTLPAYEAKVTTQNSDGTVDLEPADSSVGPGWKNVPIALQGLFQVRVQAGAACILEFLDNNPQKPIVRQFLPGATFTEAVMGSGDPAARKGDSVAIGTLTGAAPNGPVQFTFTPSGGAPVVGASVTLVGKIDAGSSIVKKVA